MQIPGLPLTVSDLAGLNGAWDSAVLTNNLGNSDAGVHGLYLEELWYAGDRKTLKRWYKPLFKVESGEASQWRSCMNSGF